MFCAKCGTKLIDGAKFCGRCGNPVKIKQPQPVEESKVTLADENRTVVLEEPECVPQFAEEPEIPFVDEDRTVVLEEPECVSQPVEEPEIPFVDENRTVVLEEPECVSQPVEEPEIPFVDEDRTVVLDQPEYMPQPVPEMLPVDEIPHIPYQTQMNDQFIPRAEDIGGYRSTESAPQKKKSKTTVILIVVLVFLLLASLATGGFFLQKAGIVDFSEMIGLGEKQADDEEMSEEPEDVKQEDVENSENAKDTAGDGNDSDEISLDGSHSSGTDGQQDESDAAAIDVASLTTDPQEMDSNRMYYYFHGSFGEPGKSIQDSNTELCSFSAGKGDDLFVSIYASSGDITYTYAQVAGYSENAILFDSVDAPSMTIRYMDVDTIEVTTGDSSMIFERADIGLKDLLESFEGTYAVSNSGDIDETHPEKITISGFDGNFSNICVNAEKLEFKYADIILGESADELLLVGEQHVYKVKKTKKGIKYSGVNYEKQ